MYAMVANVVRPARISVAKLACLISSGCPDPRRRKMRPKVDWLMASLAFTRKLSALPFHDPMVSIVGCRMR